MTIPGAHVIIDGPKESGMGTFLKSAWYAAAWAGEVTQDLLARTILGEHVLLYRKQDDTPVAIGNRCPHRFAPLSMGRRVGDNVRCGYHGLQFNDMGVCVHNPVGDGRIPKNAVVKKYPIVERDGFIWIWMGAPDAADPALIPDFSELLADKAFTKKLVSTENYIHVPANYLLIVDNLMDLTHIPTLHEGSLAARFPAIGQGEMTVRPQKRRVDVDFDVKGSPSVFRDGLVDQWNDILWEAPSLVMFHTGEVPAGRGRDGVRDDVAVHLITPETDTSTHYFFFVLIAGELGPGMDDAGTRRMVRHIFATEDAPMFEACQKMMGTSDLYSLKPVFLSVDKAAAAVRKALDDLIAEEAALSRSA
jgi:vanillate O-demethylase monooxygenase subunit